MYSFQFCINSRILTKWRLAGFGWSRGEPDLGNNNKKKNLLAAGWQSILIFATNLWVVIPRAVPKLKTTLNYRCPKWNFADKECYLFLPSPKYWKLAACLLLDRCFFIDIFLLANKLFSKLSRPFQLGRFVCHYRRRDIPQRTFLLSTENLFIHTHATI